MPYCPTVSEQLLSDLHILNDTPCLNDGSDPLVQYLSNALALARPHENARQQLEDILGELRSQIDLSCRNRVAVDDFLDAITQGFADTSSSRSIFDGFIRPLHRSFEIIHLDYTGAFVQVQAMLSGAQADFREAVVFVRTRLVLTEPQRAKLRAAIEVFTSVVSGRALSPSDLSRLLKSSEDELRFQGVFRDGGSGPTSIFMDYLDTIYRYITAGHDGWINWAGGLWGGMSQRWYLNILAALDILERESFDGLDPRMLNSEILGTRLSLRDAPRMGKAQFAAALVFALSGMCQRHYSNAVREYLRLASCFSADVVSGAHRRGRR